MLFSGLIWAFFDFECILELPAQWVQLLPVHLRWSKQGNNPHAEV